MTPALSVWLDLCRVVAALAVYIGHSVNVQVAPAGITATWSRSADDAVTAFFVISGLVIAHTTRHQHGQAQAYVLARLSRVYSVAVPAVLFVLAVDLVGMRFDASLYAPDWQYPRLWLYLPFHWLFLGETWFGAIQPLSMLPYWSLGYEVWYYVLFGCLTFVRGRRRWVVVALVLAVMGPRIVLLLPVWWLGVWLYRHMGRLAVPPALAWGLMLTAVAGYAVFFLTGLRAATDAASRALYAGVSQWLPSPFDPGSSVHVLSDYVVAGLVALFLIGCAHCRWDFGAGWGRVIRWLAGFTFTFYLIHYSLLLGVQALGLTHQGWGGYAITLMAVLSITWALGQVGEQRRGWYRALLTRLLSAVPGWRATRP